MDGFHQNGKLIDLVGLGQSSSPRVQMDQYYEPGGGGELFREELAAQGSQLQPPKWRGKS